MPLCWTPPISGLTSGFSPQHEDASCLFGPDQPDAVPQERIHLCGPCSSALDVAHHLAGCGQMDVWDSVLATRQWAGRGQLRRTWISEPGNLFVAWRLPLAPDPWQNMTAMLVGWVLCQGLRDLGCPVRLKWPNDLLLRDNKVGGILLEERDQVLLAGIGLNLASCPHETALRADHACPADFLSGILSRISILSLWLQLVHSCRPRYSATLSSLTPPEFLQSLEQVLAYLGTTVQVADADPPVQGLFTGLSQDGGIMLRTANQLRIMHSGSLRPISPTYGESDVESP